MLTQNYSCNIMKKKSFIFTLIMVAVSVCGQAATKLKTQKDSVSYALGYIMGTEDGYYMIKKYDGDKKVFAEGLQDAFNGDVSVMSKPQAMQVVRRMEESGASKRASQKEKEYEKARTQNKAYLDAKKREGYVELPNSWDSTKAGVERKVLKAGTGEVPTVSSAVKFNYAFRLTDGTLISKSGNQPTEGVVSTLLPGLQDALTSMPVGSKWEVVIPSELGYDKEAQYYDDGRVMIPANSILVFEIELLNAGMPEDIGLIE